MNEKSYHSLIQQTFDFPQKGFDISGDKLQFYGIPLMDVIKQYGTPLRLTYLPRISENIRQAKRMFNVAMAKCGYKGNYTYCYCTKSNHFSFVLEAVISEHCGLETSSAYDIDIIKALYKDGHVGKDIPIICNGFKRKKYLSNIAALVNSGFGNVVPVLDNHEEIDYYVKNLKHQVNIGIRIASEEEPTFNFYTSRLGIRYIDITDVYEQKISKCSNLKLKMLHFFLSTGIRDSIYYWSELNKCLNTYYRLKQICPTIDTLDIGGGLPARNSLGFEFDYEYMIEEIVQQVKKFCRQKGIEEPNLVTEFGTYTVAESGAHLFEVIGKKQQNDREMWYMVDNSFITSLPDTWGTNQRFILLAVNNWSRNYRRVNLGGLSCDSQDYYTSEEHANQVFLPGAKNRQYIGFFHTGAYQDALGGFGGIKHCLIPAPKHVLINRSDDGAYTTRLFSKEQSAKSMLKILGY